MARLIHTAVSKSGTRLFSFYVGGVNSNQMTFGFTTDLDSDSPSFTWRTASVPPGAGCFNAGRPAVCSDTQGNIFIFARCSDIQGNHGVVWATMTGDETTPSLTFTEIADPPTWSASDLGAGLNPLTHLIELFGKDESGALYKITQGADGLFRGCWTLVVGVLDAASTPQAFGMFGLPRYFFPGTPRRPSSFAFTFQGAVMSTSGGGSWIAFLADNNAGVWGFVGPWLALPALATGSPTWAQDEVGVPVVVYWDGGKIWACKESVGGDTGILSWTPWQKCVPGNGATFSGEPSVLISGWFSGAGTIEHASFVVAARSSTTSQTVAWIDHGALGSATGADLNMSSQAIPSAQGYEFYSDPEVWLNRGVNSSGKVYVFSIQQAVGLPVRLNFATDVVNLTA
ncbi:MAG: hypothetical protein HYZ53_03130 [Planctomycetes bacterium]|nr:hypothetical protein [Planctomycetota bacterium]